jgi:hypothetical protein
MVVHAVPHTWQFLSEILRFRTISIVLVLKSKPRKTRRFGNWVCFRPQVRENPILLGPLERASPNHWASAISAISNVVNVLLISTIHLRLQNLIYGFPKWAEMAQYVRQRLRAGRPCFDYWQGPRYYSLCHSVQTGSGAHLAPYPVGTRGSFPGS